MAFPDQDLEVTVDAAFGADATMAPASWVFTDLSSRSIGDPITISQGVLVGNGSKRSASATVTLTNDDGALTPLLATSPYWPYVDVGTPMRIRVRSNTVPWIVDNFQRTSGSGWGVADSGQTWTTNTGMTTNGTSGQISITPVNTVRYTRILRPHDDAEVLWDMSIAAVSTGASHVVGAFLRGNSTHTDYLWAGMEFDVGGTIKWTIRSSIATVWTALQGVTEPGLTYSAGTVIRCRVEAVGARLRARAWLAAGTEPQTWTVDTTCPLFTGAGRYVGVMAWCVNGNTNTLPDVISIDNLSFVQPKYPRIEGYITDVRPSFTPLSDGTTHSTVQIDIGGIGSRLERREAPAWSPMRRSLQKSAVPPIAYWSLEDAKAALSAASAFPGLDPMTVTGPAVFEFDTGVPTDEFLNRYGSTALCSVAAGAKLTGAVPQSTTGAWTVSGSLDEYTPGIGGGVTEVRMLEWATPSGTHTRWALVRTMTGHTVRAYNDAAGTSTDVVTYANFFGQLIAFDVTAEQSGGNINVTFYANANPFASGSVAGTLGPPIRVTVNPDRVNTTGSTDPFGIRFLAGHIAVHDQALTAGLPYYLDGSLFLRADRAWAFEYAHRRLLRLCAEERIPCQVLGDPYTSGTTQLGAQQEGAFVDLVSAAVEAESGGLLVEGGFGLVHTPRTQRYNQPVALVVDMATYARGGGTSPTDVLVPKLDARGPNFWTVQRTSGSESSYAAGQAFRDRRGTITQKATLDVLYDSDTGPHAQWRTHLHVDGQQANYPSFQIDLAANPGLCDDWLTCTIGSRVQRINQPTIAGYGIIDQVIDGITETIAPRQSDSGPEWTATIDASPASVWDVGVYDTSSWDSGSTTLGSNVTSAGTLLRFSTTHVGDVWTQTTAPIDVVCAGQTNTVRWMSGVGSVTLLEGGFETGVAGWTATGATLAQSAAFAHAGVYSAQMTVSGSPATASISAATQMPVSASTAYTATCWVYAPSSVPNARVTISWYTSAGVFISSSLSSTITATNTWTQLTLSTTSPGTAGLARVGPAITGSPANGTVLYVDDVDLTADGQSTSGAGPYVQQAWVSRPADVTKALPAGEPIHCASAGTWAL